MFLEEKSQWKIADGTEYVYGPYLMLFITSPPQKLATEAIDEPIRALVRSVKMTINDTQILNGERSFPVYGTCRVVLRPNRWVMVPLVGKFGSDGLPIGVGKDMGDIWFGLHNLPSNLVKQFWLADHRKTGMRIDKDLQEWALERRHRLKYWRKLS